MRYEDFQTGHDDIAGAVIALAYAVDQVAKALERLGMNDAAGGMGAIEGLGYQFKRIAEEGLTIYIEDSK